jgi:hypothetical protein
MPNIDDYIRNLNAKIIFIFFIPVNRIKLNFLTQLKHITFHSQKNSFEIEKMKVRYKIVHAV